MRNTPKRFFTTLRFADCSPGRFRCASMVYSSTGSVKHRVACHRVPTLNKPKRFPMEMLHVTILIGYATLRYGVYLFALRALPYLQRTGSNKRDPIGTMSQDHALHTRHNVLPGWRTQKPPPTHNSALRTAS